MWRGTRLADTARAVTDSRGRTARTAHTCAHISPEATARRTRQTLSPVHMQPPRLRRPNQNRHACHARKRFEKCPPTPTPATGEGGRGEQRWLTRGFAVRTRLHVEVRPGLCVIQRLHIVCVRVCHGWAGTLRFPRRHRLGKGRAVLATVYLLCKRTSVPRRWHRRSKPQHAHKHTERAQQLTTNYVVMLVMDKYRVRGLFRP